MVLATACMGDDGPYLEFLGGGFVMNYRMASAEYGFVVRRVRPIPEGTIIEARLEDPGGGEPFVLREAAAWNRLEYVFRSPPLRGVRAGRDYRVEVRLIEASTQRVLSSYARTFRAEVDQAILPDRPTVIGPGHRPAPR